MRATAPLERSAQLHVAEPVDEDRFVRYLESAPQPWTDEEQRLLQPILSRLEQHLPSLNWQRAKPILLVKAAADFEDGLLAPPAVLASVLAHELFHVISRDDPALRERLYAAIGFKPCAGVEIPEAVAKLRVSNPDAPQHRHTIAVRYRGQAVEAMPFPSFPSESIDPREGFKTQVRIAWLLVERQGLSCKARAPEGAGPATQELEGLFEQVGRNTRYLWHPEEILADNFALLFLGLLRGAPPRLPSPEVIERMRAILVRP